MTTKIRIELIHEDNLTKQEVIGMVERGLRVRGIIKGTLKVDSYPAT